MCDDNFNQNAANAICSFLGYEAGDAKWTSGDKWSIQSEYRISLDDVTCRSDDWSACTYREYSNCQHGEDVFLTCNIRQEGIELIITTSAAISYFSPWILMSSVVNEKS